MTSMNIMGTYSGVTMDTVDQLIAAERARGSKFTSQKTKIETEQNAWKDINTRLDSLFKKLEAFSKPETFNSHTVKSSMNDSAMLKVSAGSKAAVGQYRVQVNQLATATTLTGLQVEIGSIYDELNASGTISFPSTVIEKNEAGEIIAKDPIQINIEEGDSLKVISDKINEQSKDIGVTASIVDKHLILTSTSLGDSKITFESQPDNQLLEKLGLAGKDDEPDPEPKTGQNSIMTINDIEVERSTNSIDDVVEGLTFTLTNKHKTGESEVITVAEDRAKTTQAVKDFVEQYNSTMDFITKQMDVGDPTAEDNKTGSLTGDGTLMRLQSGLRSIMTRNLEGEFSGEFKNLEDIGIELDRYGVATLDEAAFNKALETDATNVAKFFYSPDIAAETNAEGEVTTEAKKQDGISELLRNFIDTYISTSTTTPGVIKNKDETYDRMLKDITQQIETFNTRIDRKRERYIQQFTALDIAMMQAESQMDYLYSQLGMESTK